MNSNTDTDYGRNRMPITPPAASLPDIRPDFDMLHIEDTDFSTYGSTTCYHSPQTGQQVIHHVHRDNTVTRGDAEALGAVLSPTAGAHVIITCNDPEDGFAKALAKVLGPDITITLCTAEQRMANEWLYADVAKLSIFEALLHSTDLRSVLYAEQLGPWEADSQGVALAHIHADLADTSHALDERFDGRFAEGYRSFWQETGELTTLRLQRLRNLAEPVQWALEGIIRDGVIHSDEPEAVWRRIKRIETAVNQLMEALEPDDTTDTGQQ